MCIAFMNLNELPDVMNDISWRWKCECLSLTTNSLIPCDRQTQAVAYDMTYASVTPGPGGWSPVVTSIIGEPGRLWPVTLSLSLSAATLRQCRHSPLTLQRSVLVGLCYPSDRCQWSNQCFVTPHNNKSIHLLMCCFVFCVTHWWLCYSNLCRKK